MGLTTGGAAEVRSLRRVAEGHVVQRAALGLPEAALGLQPAAAAGAARPVVAPAVAEDGAVFVAACMMPPAPAAGAGAGAGVGGCEGVRV